MSDDKIYTTGEMRWRVHVTAFGEAVPMDGERTAISPRDGAIALTIRSVDPETQKVNSAQVVWMDPHQASILGASLRTVSRQSMRRLWRKK